MYPSPYPPYVRPYYYDPRFPSVPGLGVYSYGYAPGGYPYGYTSAASKPSSTDNPPRVSRRGADGSRNIDTSAVEAAILTRAFSRMSKQRAIEFVHAFCEMEIEIGRNCIELIIRHHPHYAMCGATSSLEREALIRGLAVTEAWIESFVDFVSNRRRFEEFPKWWAENNPQWFAVRDWCTQRVHETGCLVNAATS